MEPTVYAAFSPPRAGLRPLLPLLPPCRRARLLRTPERTWSGPLLAWSLLAWALGEAGVAPYPSVAVTDRGKPYFPDRPDLCFSLSHTAGAAACALADRPVGVDIEHPRPLSPRLLALLGAGNEGEGLTRWVCREAAAKALGVPHTLRERAEGEETCQVEHLADGYVLAVSQPSRLVLVETEALLGLLPG